MIEAPALLRHALLGSVRATGAAILMLVFVGACGRAFGEIYLDFQILAPHF